MADFPPEPVTINRLLDAVFPSFALLAGMELDLFSALEDGPRTLEQLSERIGVRSNKLGPLVYALVVGGLLDNEDHSFSLTTEAGHFLVRNKPSYMGGKAELIKANWTRVLNSAATVRAGEPPEIFDFHSMSDDERRFFFRGLYPGAVADGQRLMELCDFSDYSELLDVGGGSGGLAIIMAQAYPRLKATVLDLPAVTPIALEIVNEAEAGDQIEVLAADAVRDTLPGIYDVIVARHLIQVLSEEDGRALLKNLASVLQPGGTLYIIGWILDDSRISPPQMVGSDLILLNTTKDGQAYTESEYREWMRDAGFVDIERKVMPDGVSFVRAGKAE